MTKFLNISTDNTLGGNSPSDDIVSSQKAIKTYVDAHGGGGSVAIDDSTITKNSSDEIQAVATVNANAAAGATNPIYDWVGTLAEYEAQAVATNHPDWVCYITDDCETTPIPIRREASERNIGEIVYSLVPVSDGGLHLADGDLLDGAGIYADFYTYMVGVYNNGHTSIFCSEADWQTSNSTYGKCGKFVLDTTNHTIRLPKMPGFAEGTLTESEIGGLIEAGLPDITGEQVFGQYGAAKGASSGAFSGSITNNSANCDGGGGAYGKSTTLIFAASNSNTIYGNSTTVQPEAIKVYVYVVIANTQKTPVQVDIDNIATQLNTVSSKTNEMYPHRVIAFQSPTSANNYTWYRKYADGWVEQGGRININTTSVTLLVEMSDSDYHCVVTYRKMSGNSNTVNFQNIATLTQTTTGFTVLTASSSYRSWFAQGMAA